jgi:hypothetical protein
MEYSFCLRPHGANETLGPEILPFAAGSPFSAPPEINSRPFLGLLKGIEKTFLYIF